MLVSLSVNAHWAVQNTGLTANLYDIGFINRYTGWTLEDGGKILKATSGGVTYDSINTISE